MARLIPFQPLLFQRQSDDQRAQAYRSGAGDAAIVGGADTLSRMPINGFPASNRSRPPYVSRLVVTAQVHHWRRGGTDVINP